MEALVIGASRGIGLSLARELAGRGWRVTATERGPSELRSLDGVAVEQVNVADEASCADLVARLAGRRFRLVLLNAGIYGPRDATADSATSTLIAELMMVNAIGPVRLARRLLPLIEEGGTLAFMSSRMGSVAANTTGNGELYRASKAALNSLTRSLAAKEARGHAVLTLHPGWVRTDMGGAGADLSVEESVAGLAEVLLAPRPAGTHHFLDYAGNTIPW